MSTEEIMLILAGTLVSSSVAYFVPALSYRFAVFKCKEKGRPLPSQQVTSLWKIVSVVFCAVFSGLTLSFMPFNLAVLSILFCLISVFGIFVDQLIRIIANKMLLIMLIPGAVYRLLDGGAGSFPEAFGAVLMVMVIFGGAAMLMRILTGTSGVGMGDIKLSMVIALIIGWPGVMVFLVALAATVSMYCMVGMRLHVLSLNDTFPMCGPIMMGFLIALLHGYLPYLEIRKWIGL